MLPIVLITGNMAAGKSTIAQALAERLPRSVHLRGDSFRRMIVRGQAEMSAVLSDEAWRQLQLRYDLAVLVAMRYADAGFQVIYQDIIIGPALEQMAAAFAPYPLKVVVLCPHPTIVAARERTRSKIGYGNEAEVYAFDRILREDTPRIGYWLDNTDLSVAETVDQILARVLA